MLIIIRATNFAFLVNQKVCDQIFEVTDFFVTVQKLEQKSIRMDFQTKYAPQLPLTKGGGAN